MLQGWPVGPPRTSQCLQFQISNLCVLSLAVYRLGTMGSPCALPNSSHVLGKKKKGSVMIIWPVSKCGVMGAEGPQRRDVATPASSSQGKKKKSSVLFRLKGGKEAVAEAGGRVAEGNGAGQGVSLADKQGWGLSSLCLGSSSPCKWGGTSPPRPGGAPAPRLCQASILGSMQGFLIARGHS